MRAVIQRVSRASVHVRKSAGGEELVSEIGVGLLTLLGVREGDSREDADNLIRKIVALRIFEDDAGKMNRSLLDVGGEHLIVSQFTLWASTDKGARPSFTQAAKPEIAEPLYDRAIELSRELGVKTEGGRFRTSMRVTLENDGPITLVIES